LERKKKGKLFNLRLTECIIVANMQNKIKLAILSALLLVSAIPIVTFLFFTNYSQFYLNGLINGSAYININAQKGFLEIVSKTITLIPLRLSFLEASTYIISIVVFCLSLVLVARSIYKIKVKHQTTKNATNMQLI
jgi:hypothetical protein